MVIKKPVTVLTGFFILLGQQSLLFNPVFDWGFDSWKYCLTLGLAVWFLFRGGRHYDIRQVIGIKHIREGTADTAITETGELDTSGVLEMTRHPWYLATVLLVWARQMDVSAIIVNVILTVYLIVGTYLEEQKLEKKEFDK